MTEKEYDNNAMLGSLIVGGLIALVFCLTVAYFTGSDETLIRQNEQCLYENAKLKDANTRLLDELSEGIPNWEDIK
jgi:hypothetical protein